MELYSTKRYDTTAPPQSQVFHRSAWSDDLAHPVFWSWIIPQDVVDLLPHVIWEGFRLVSLDDGDRPFPQPLAQPLAACGDPVVHALAAEQRGLPLLAEVLQRVVGGQEIAPGSHLVDHVQRQ